jgi:hypothetical protein
MVRPPPTQYVLPVLPLASNAARMEIRVQNARPMQTRIQNAIWNRYQIHVLRPVRIPTGQIIRMMHLLLYVLPVMLPVYTAIHQVIIVRDVHLPLVLLRE